MEEVPNDGLIRIKELFGQDALIPTSPEMFKSILVENVYDYHKQEKVAGILRVVLGDGLILVEDDVHKFQRKRMSLIFAHIISANIHRSHAIISVQGHTRIVSSFLVQSL